MGGSLSRFVVKLELNAGLIPISTRIGVSPSQLRSFDALYARPQEHSLSFTIAIPVRPKARARAGNNVTDSISVIEIQRSLSLSKK